MQSRENKSFADTLQGEQQPRDKVAARKESASKGKAEDAGATAEQEESMPAESGKVLPAVAAEVAVSMQHAESGPSADSAINSAISVPPTDHLASASAAEINPSAVSPSVISAPSVSPSMNNSALVSPAEISLLPANRGETPVSSVMDPVDLARITGVNPLQSEKLSAAEMAPVKDRLGTEALPQARKVGQRIGEQTLLADGKAVLTRLNAEGLVTSGLQQASLSGGENNPAAAGRPLLEGINTPPSARSTVPAVEIPLSDSRWGAAVAQRAVVAIQQGLQQAEVRITPANLGPIEMHIQLQDEKASVTMVSPHAAVREMLESATPRLRELLEQQGMSLEQNLVSDHSSQQSKFAGAGGEHEDLAGQESGLDDGEIQSEPVRRQLGLFDHYA